MKKKEDHYFPIEKQNIPDKQDGLNRHRPPASASLRTNGLQLPVAGLKPDKPDKPLWLER